MNVAVLQLPYIGMSLAKIDYYLRIAQKKQVKVLVLGEYILNPFFHELTDTPVNMIKEQTQKHLETLRKFAQEYEMCLIAPLVTVRGGKCVKTVAKICGKSTAYYEQQLLINYPHWNEEKHFANTMVEFTGPLTFVHNKIKFAIMNGFEVHFDAFFKEMDLKNVDVLLLPSIGTFDSADRWKEIVKMRSFTHNIYIVRANRIGEYKEPDGHVWRFYGDSFATDPYGNIDTSLGDAEELMIVQVDKAEVKSARKSWGFVNSAKKL